ncbi:peptide-N(4)-(N-acetyl-beta-glucosaminyl)asparagine amidase isoform X1 [Microplitis demolitor]|uniref:peptide-N(4)-(N-acetyl-beta- glucosaminyl)asparagine amidase isoform X1 n=2 Tax=Microplitis demolitor TaxID=69319 RepID=UPI0004CDB50A|nr:peptide-N(4)-(N-acetyl-beta-glucosaminyl)asparagine amidase isoform X1 [Microplitis demolitor]XP_053594998.1 peptide-N(4)-(N-acetyl-beta-glucosaminyl)asparagine amidase isoform X1 [Microplitis demolitor]
MSDNLGYCLSLLGENDIKIQQSALKILCELCDNILKYPEEHKYRKIRIANPSITDKLLPASGAIECLFELGFIEDGEFFSLPKTSSLSQLQKGHKLLNELRNKVMSETKVAATPAIKSTGAKPKDLKQSKNFLETIASTFQEVLRYENKELQKYTKHFVPIDRLQLEAIKKMRVIQKNLKLNNSKSNNNESHFSIEHKMTIEDLVLVELVHWFKNEFFSWMNSPTCRFCSNICSFHRNEFRNDPRVSRVEVHKCESCEAEEEFPRYTDPKILLTTRKGRCGEWANAFTLISRTFGYDTRIVYDQTDHVWSEVWSVAENRWIHVDPCEDVIDRPLLYEKGWKKKLTYVIAYSKDEVQDVTWRYTRDPNIFNRRNLTSESSLLSLILRLNEERFNLSGLEYSDARKKYVIKRRLMELAELLPAPPGTFKLSDNSDNNDYGGRISGDAAWRLARGELSETHEPYLWKVQPGLKVFKLNYSILKDTYEVYNESDKRMDVKEGWSTGVNKYEGGIFRNTEQDWKMVYLARSPGNEIGKVTWSIELPDELDIELFELRATVATFDNANIQWTIEGINNDNVIVLSVDDCKYYKTNQLEARKINVIVKLLGGSGDVSWQHAQLFRQSLNASENYSMQICITFKQMT